MYHFPDQEDDEADKTMSRKDRMLSKLNQRYVEERSRGGAPELTEEEKFWQEKEKQAKSSFGTKQSKSGKLVSKEQKQYDLLLENQVDFVKSDLMEGLIEKELKE